MFINFGNFSSVNSLGDIPLGRYSAKFETFVGDAFVASLSTYTLDGEKSPRAADLVYIDSGRRAYLRDFVVQADYQWRDSVGFLSEALLALLPPEMSACEAIETQYGVVDNPEVM